MRPLPRQWFRVPDRERVLHRVLGVGHFWWLLDVIGWNREITRMRAFSGTKAGLVSLEQSVRAGAIAHAICFAIHVVLAVFALSTEHPWSGALWMLLPAVIPHVYPVFMQRSILLRLQPLLDNAALVARSQTETPPKCHASAAPGRDFQTDSLPRIAIHRIEWAARNEVVAACEILWRFG